MLLLWDVPTVTCKRKKKLHFAVIHNYTVLLPFSWQGIPWQPNLHNCFKKMISRRMTKLLSWCGNMVLNGGRSLLSISRGGLANSAVKGTYPCYSSSLMKYLSCLWLIKANNITFSLCGTIQVQ